MNIQSKNQVFTVYKLHFQYYSGDTVKSAQDADVEISSIIDLMSSCAAKLACLQDMLGENPDYQQAHVLIPCILFHEAFEKFSNLPPALALRKESVFIGGQFIY